MYCTNPHTHLEVKADGSVYCCCEGWLPTPLGNVFEEDLLRVWSGPVARKIRQAVAAGNFGYCTACPYLPGPGGPVRAGAAPNAGEPARIGVLKLDYDQTCNLACPSCRSRHSREFVDVGRVAQIAERTVTREVLALTDLLYVTGAGDPIASPHYWGLLRGLPPLPEHPGLSVFLHTNGQLLDEGRWEDLGPTRDRVSTVGISVDASTEETYRKIRGGSFGRLWDNVGYLRDVREEYCTSGRPGGRHLQLGMFFTVQADNFREIVPFLRLVWNHGADWVSVTALRNWGTYSEEDFRRRAVYLPDHPDHEEFQQAMTHPALRDRRVTVGSFDPRHARQDVVVCAGALLRGRGGSR